MRKAKKLLALTVALASTLTFAACGGKNDSSSSIPGVALDSEKVEQLNEAVDGIDWGNTDLANKTVKWLAHYDINPANGKTEDPAFKLFQDKYDGKIEWVQATWQTRYDRLATLVSSNDSPDMFPASDMDAFPMGVIAGMFQPIDPYIDLNSEYWKDIKDVCDIFSINDKHYVAAIKSEPNLICVYNTAVVEEHGYDQPADLYYDGEWTWDVMQEMVIDFTDADQDMYGFDGYWWWNGISQTTGVPMIGFEDGKVVNNLENPELQKAQDLIYELTKAGVGFPRHLNNWSTRGSTDSGSEGMGQGLTLFIPVGFYEIEDTLEGTADLGDVSAGEVMFVPMPSADGSDPYMPTRVTGYCLVAGAKNPEGFAAWMFCNRVADQTPEVQEIGRSTLVDDYGWTTEMMEMRDECYRLALEKPVFEFYGGVSSGITSAFDTIAVATSNTSGEAMTWASVVADYNNGVNYYVDEANADIEKAIAKGN